MLRPVLLLALLAGCNAILGMHSPERASTDGAIDALSVFDTPHVIDTPTGYRATAVHFDPNGGDYLETGTLNGSTGSSAGMLSVWLHFNGSDGATQMIAVAQVALSGGVFKNSNNKLQFQLNGCNGALLLDMQTQNTYTSNSGWIHVLAAWDVAANKAEIYVNGVPDRASGATISSGAICYNAPKWGVGGLSSATLDADVADLYASFGTFVDLNVAANRAKFRTAAGKPTDPGADCSGLDGITPIACLTGPLATWHTNKGTGGGFTLVGDGLSAAATSPSD